MSDKDKKAGEKPLKNKKVHVTVRPHKEYAPDQREYSRRVKEHLKEEIERVVEEKEQDGSDAQFDAADQKLDEAKKGVNGDKVREIEVQVEGSREDERGVDERVSRTRKVKPGD